jgi:hypothetical protein
MNPSLTRDPNPTAQVIVNGLALLCFSQLNGGRAEVGCLKLLSTPHTLNLTIYNPDCGVHPVDGVPVSLEINDGIVNINSDNPGIGSLYYPDIDSPEDKYSFRHMLNIDKIHDEFGSGKVKIKVPADGYLGEIYINKGVFYTEALSSRKATIHLKGDDRKKILEIPHVGKVFGADINDPIVKIDITVGGTTETITLQRQPNQTKPYTIMIKYKCIEAAGEITDFEQFYRMLNLPDVRHKETDLKYDGVETPYRHSCERALLKGFLFNEMHRAKILENQAIRNLVESFFFATEACETATKPRCPENLRGTNEPCP